LLLAFGVVFPFASNLIKRPIISALAIAALFFLLILRLIAKEGIRNTVTFDENAVIVLGSGIRSTARLNISRKSEPIIVATSGKGYGEDISEAEAIGRYLILNGVSIEKIILEDRSKNTHENFENVKCILSDSYNVAIVTSEFHMVKALRIAGKYGFIARSYNAPLDWYLRIASFLCETLSIVKFWLT
jgi:uncharacterized SAM-binding protein YcdF (DUF218 family)